MSQCYVMLSKTSAQKNPDTVCLWRIAQRGQVRRAAAQRDPVRYDTPWYGVKEYGGVLYDLVWSGLVWHCIVLCLQYGTPRSRMV